MDTIMDMDTVMDMDIVMDMIMAIMIIVTTVMDTDIVMIIMVMTTVMELDILGRALNSVFLNKSLKHTNRLSKSLSYHSLPSLVPLHLITSQVSTLQWHQLCSLMTSMKTLIWQKMFQRLRSIQIF